MFVTGHKGFLGTALSKDKRMAKGEHQGFDIKDGTDIRNEKQIIENIRIWNPDTVVHLAAVSGRLIHEPPMRLTYKAR